MRGWLVAAMLIARVALAGSEATPTPAPEMTPPPGPSGTPMFTPTPTPTPEPGTAPKGTSEDLPAVKAFRKIEDKFPFFRGAAGGGLVDFQRDAYSKTGGNKSDVVHSSVRGPSGVGEASIGAFVQPKLLVALTAMRHYVAKPSLEREGGGDDLTLVYLEIVSGGIGAEWHVEPRGSGPFFGAMLGGGYARAPLPDNPAEVENLGAGGLFVSLNAGYMQQLPWERFRGGIQVRLLGGFPMHGEVKGADKSVTYAEDDRAVTLSVMATLGYF